MCLNAGAMGRRDAETETLIPTTGAVFDDALGVAHSLRGEGFDASEDGTGRGTPIVPVHTAPTLRAGGNSTGGTRPYGTDVDTCDSLIPVAYSIMPMNSGKDYKARETDVAQPIMAGGPVGGNQGGYYIAHPIAFDTTQITSPANFSNPKPGDPCHPLAAGAHPPTIAFTAKDYGADAMDDCSPTLRAGGFMGSHANGGVMPAVAFAIQERAVSENLENGPQGKGYQEGVAYTLEARNKVQSVAASAVRRLTPTECERLQGFPDGYTAIPWRGKGADQCPDGPRYKALGNSMAVPCMAWIGERIAAVEAIINRDEAA